MFTFSYHAVAEVNSLRHYVIMCDYSQKNVLTESYKRQCKTDPG